MSADEPDAPESSTFRKLVQHVVDEMPAHVIFAVVFVAFLFFYGLATNLYKISGNDIATLEFPLGPVAGLVGAAVTAVFLIRLKYRKK